MAKQTAAKSKSKTGSKAKQIIMDDFDRELNESFKYLEGKLGDVFGGPLGRIVRKVADELFGWFVKMGGTERGRRSFEMILDEAQRFNGKNVDDIIEKSMEAYLKLNELFLRADRNHESLDKLKALLHEEYEARLKIYGPLMGATADSYGELVRKTFPDRKVLDKLMKDQFDATEKVLDLIANENGLMRIPTLVRKPVLKVVRSSYALMRERIEKGTDKIYS
ncbi:MAG: hypothetical protein HYT87_17090 [Nitrospirae bacterium]|nr:hypothetical protein [Nitrospirota bacterium]